MSKVKKTAENPRMEHYLSSSDQDDDQQDHEGTSGSTAKYPLKIKSLWQSGIVRKEVANEATKVAKKASYAKSQTASSSKKKATIPKMSAELCLVDEDDDEVEEPDEPVEGNMKTIMSLLGMDFSKSVQAKRQKLDKYTDDVIEKHTAKLQKVMNTQLDARKGLLEDLRQNSNEVLEQWEKDLKSLKDQESKLMKQFEQHMKTSQQLVNQESQRAAALRKVQSAFLKAQQEMDERHKTELGLVNGDLRKEMERVHKKQCQQKAQQALANARKSLMQDI